jgi:hypothetical protein
VHGLVTFKRWGDEMKQLPKFVLVFFLFVLELAVENFFVWWAYSPFSQHSHLCILSRANCWYLHVCGGLFA